MPPQQGLFAVPYGSAHKARTGYLAGDMSEMGPVAPGGGGGPGPVYAHHGHVAIAGPSSRGHGAYSTRFCLVVVLNIIPWRSGA